MKSLRIDLRGCYGIGSFEETLDFSDGRRHAAVYAPNGVMKSSLARTFADIGNGESRDRIFDREYGRSVVDDKGDDLLKDRILVIRPYGDTKDAAASSSGILASERLRRDYDEIKGGLEAKKAVLVKAIGRTSGLSGRRALESILRDFGRDPKDVRSFYELVEELAGGDPDELAPVRGIAYGAVFHDRVLQALKDSNFLQHRAEYMSKYNRLIDESPYLQRKFDLSRAGTARNRLMATNFFGAGHRVTLVSPKGDKNMDMVDDEKFEKILEEEEKRVDAGSMPEWKKISDDLSATAETRRFLEILSGNRELLAELGDPDALRKKLWRAYLTADGSPAGDLAAEYRAGRAEMARIAEAARKEATAWDRVVEKYKERFRPRFGLSVANKAGTLLDDAAPSLDFTFADDSSGDNKGEASMNQARLEDTLSEGERRAFYMLNALFEIEGRIERRQETVIVIDDIADSFDYKNKQAIVQYLKEASNHEFFHLLILTHNFDFFRSVHMRGIVGYDRCYYARRDGGRVGLYGADNIRDPLQHIIRNLGDDKNFVASVPFARNMIGYADGAGDPEYATLSSVLHYRRGTDTITAGQVLDIIYDVFPKARARPAPGIPGCTRMIDVVGEAAKRARKEAGEDPGRLGLVDKIVMSIHIRVAAERFMSQAVHGGAPEEHERDGTPELVEKYREHAAKTGGGPDDAVLEVLDRVVLMTPEIIHINSFMYEPILDMPADSIARLYDDVCALGGGGGGA